MDIKIIGLTLILFVALTSKAQKHQYGLQIAPSYSNQFQQFDGDIVPLSSKEKIIGLSGGVFYNLKFSRLSIRNSIDIQNKIHLFDSDFDAKDVNGNNIGSYSNNQYNLYTTISSFAAVRCFSKNSFIAFGFTANFLMYSFQRTPGIGLQGQSTEAGLIRNYLYNPVTFSLPVMIGHDWEFSSIFLKAYFDLTNRLPKESYIKQTENMIQIGYGIVINRN